MDVKTGTVLEAILEATRSSEEKVKEETSGHFSCSHFLKTSCCILCYQIMLCYTVIKRKKKMLCYTAYCLHTHQGWEAFDMLCTSKHRLTLGVYLLVDIVTFNPKSFSISAHVWAVTTIMKCCVIELFQH